MPDIWAAIRDNWAAYFTVFLVAALGATYFAVVRPRRRRRAAPRRRASRPQAARRATPTRTRRTGTRPQRRPRRRK